MRVLGARHAAVTELLKPSWAVALTVGRRSQKLWKTTPLTVVSTPDERAGVREYYAIQFDEFRRRLMEDFGVTWNNDH
jgi:hypothetical protein